MKKHYFVFLFAVFSWLGLQSQTPTWNWAQKLTGPYYDFSYDITKDADEDIYITGQFDTWLFDGNDTLKAYGGKDGYLLKMNTNGVIKKIIKVGSRQVFSAAEESVSCIAVDPQKNIYIAGRYNTDSLFIDTIILPRYSGQPTNTNYAFIAKLDSNFKAIWAKPIKCGSIDFPSSLEVDKDGNVYLTGKFAGNFTMIGNDSILGNGRMTIVKFNPNGNILWYRNFGGSGEITDVAFDNNNDVYITGVFIGTAQFGNATLSAPNTNEDACVLKLSKTNGSIIWLKHITGIGRSFATAIEVSSADEVYVGGYFGSNTDYKKDTLIIGNDSVIAASSDYEDIFLAKMDLAGNVLWLKRYGATYNDYLYSMRLDSSDRLYFAGYFTTQTIIGNNTFTGSGDVIIAHIDSLGGVVWVGKGGGPNSSDRPSGLMPLDNGQVFVCGIYNQITYFGNIMLTANTTYGTGQSDVYLATIYYPLITSLNEAASNLISFAVYPNPADNYLSILSADKISYLKIYDLNGRELLADYSVNKTTIDISALPAGFYVLEVSVNGNIGRKKFIKE